MADIWNYASLFGTGGEMASGINQANKADKELAKLKAIKGYADYEYLTGQQIYNQANAIATGLSPAEKAYAQQGINRAATTNYRMLSDRNPTLSGVAQGIVNDKTAMANLNLVAQDAATRRRSLENLIPLIGNQANLQETAKTGLEIKTLEQLGMSKQAGLTNAHNSKETIRNSIMSFWGGGSKSNPYDTGTGNSEQNPGMSDGGFGTNRTESGYGGMGQNSGDAWGGNSSRFSEDDYYKRNFPYLYGNK